MGLLGSLLLRHDELGIHRRPPTRDVCTRPTRTQSQEVTQTRSGTEQGSLRTSRAHRLVHQRCSPSHTVEALPDHRTGTDFGAHHHLPLGRVRYVGSACFLLLWSNTSLNSPPDDVFCAPTGLLYGLFEAFPIIWQELRGFNPGEGAYPMMKGRRHSFNDLGSDPYVCPFRWPRRWPHLHRCRYRYNPRWSHQRLVTDQIPSSHIL